MKKRLLAYFSALFCLASFASLRAFTLPPGFSEQAIGSGWDEPVGVAFDPSPAAANRIYVWERAGRVWIVENGVKLATPLLDISDEVGAWRDFGMLGLALHPNFHENGYLYVSYVVDRHHLLNAGTAAYNPAANEYFAPTIGRITRYTARASDDFKSVDPASRKILLGETKSTGFPICYQSHGTGQLVFGNDGTLLASCGDSASVEEVDNGSNPNLTYAAQALADGIITAKENVGSFRSQLIDCLGGKIIRIDPETGSGVPGNPFYDPAQPRAPRSRVWALGFRNPFRFTIRPETGSHDPAEADPGVIVLGDVGWGSWEEIDVINGPGKNCGWPLFEGLTRHESFIFYSPENRDAPNPLGGFFKFRDLLVHETLATPSWPNPLDPAQQVPASIPHFMHSRPVLQAGHNTNPDGPALAATFADTTASEILVGAAGSPVAGPQYGANASVGGVFYTGSDFPESYRGTYFHADFGHGWIKNFVFDANHRLTQVSDFAEGGAPVFLATHPTLGALYAVDYGSATVFKISYAPGGNLAPSAAASASITLGASPLSVDFSSVGSADPDGQPLAYLWDFGDGTTSTLPSPTHVFTFAAAKRFDVTLTVTDAGNATAQATLQIFVNHTLPDVTLLGPIDGTKYPLGGDTEYALTRRVIEVPGHPTTTEWKVFLHHNQHEHGEPAVTGASAVALISPIHSLTETYYFRIQLTVTDDLGAKVTRNARLYPNAANIAPQAAWSQVRQTLVVNASPQVLDSAATLTDSDSPGIEFGRLRVALTNPRAGDTLTILHEGLGLGQVGIAGNRVLFSGAVVGTKTGGTGITPLVIVFNEAATPAAAQAILRRVAGAFPIVGTRSATAMIADGDGGVLVTAPLLVRVIAIPNVPPTITLKRPLDQSTYNAPAAIPLVAAASDADGRVVKVEFFSGSQKLGEVTAAPFVFVLNGVSNGQYSFTAKATDDAGGVTTSAPINVTVNGINPLPAGWQSHDIGKASGFANSTSNVFTVRSAGAGIGATADELHFVWQPWTGDGEIIARVDSLRMVTVQSFGGLMFRESLLPNARQVSVAFQTNSRATLRWRDGIAPTIQRTIALTPALPGWLKLSRQGSVFTGSTSTDGITWTAVGTAALDLPAQCLVGLTASASGGIGARTIVAFSNVTGP
ncbi:MAG: PQQ-dependent sugar dehydrogenase [Chthoniobacteraceae bacterium]